MQIHLLNPLHKLLDIKVKVLFFLLLFFYIIGLFVVALSTFRSDDPIPDSKTISYEMRKEFGDLSSRVKVGIYIRNFPTFNFITNNFVVNAMIWFEFNKNEVLLSSISQFSFENSKILHKSDPYVTFHNGKMLVQYDVIFETKTDVNFYRFPLEDHRLSIVLTNNFISPNEMYFDDSIGALSFIVSDRLFTSDWDVYALTSSSGYASLAFDKYAPKREMLSPRAIFTIDFRKAGINKILLIFVPLFSAILLAFFSFLMSFNNHNGKATVGLTAITALLGYRLVIQQMSPPVGYFTLTDKIFTFFLIFAFLIFIFQVLLTRHYFFWVENEKIKRFEQPETDVDYLPPRVTEYINAAAYYIFISVFVVVITHLIMV